MASKDYQAIANGIIANSGSDGNFLTVTNCATRVRITYKDPSVVDIEAIKELDDVLTVIANDEAIQVVVGPGVCGQVASRIQSTLAERGHTVGADPDAEGAVIEEDGVGKRDIKGLLRIFSEIFVPILPAMIASGILRGFANIIGTIAASQATAAGIQATETLTAAQVWMQDAHLYGLFTLMNIIYSATFSYLAIYVGFQSAKQFKVSPAIGALIGCFTLSADLANIGASAGQGGLMGVIAGVLLYSYVEKYMKKIIPDAVDVIFTPTLSVLVTAAAMVLILMPVCGVITEGITGGLMWLLDTTGAFGGFALSILAPSLIATGLHHGLTVIHMEMLNTIGTAPLAACQVMSNAGMVGASCAILFMTKDPKVKKACQGAIPTSFLCVGEPVIYGVCLPSGFGFITGSIGAGVGGFFIRLFDVSFDSLGMAGMSAIPLVADNKYLYYLLCYFIGAAAAFALTLVVGKARHYE